MRLVLVLVVVLGQARAGTTLFPFSGAPLTRRGMNLLGAIIAGGGSRRFGGDKAAAMLDGRALIDHVADALTPQVSHIIVCGRQWGGRESVADWPAPDLGPLGGLCAALRHAAANRYDAVLTAGCDVLPVPDLRALSGPVAAVMDGHWLFGFWPVGLCAALEHYLQSEPDRSMRGWVASVGARHVASAELFHNLNTAEDLNRYRALRGMAA